MSKMPVCLEHPFENEIEESERDVLSGTAGRAHYRRRMASARKLDAEMEALKAFSRESNDIVSIGGARRGDERSEVERFADAVLEPELSDEEKAQQLCIAVYHRDFRRAATALEDGASPCLRVHPTMSMFVDDENKYCALDLAFMQCADDVPRARSGRIAKLDILDAIVRSTSAEHVYEHLAPDLKESLFERIAELGGTNTVDSYLDKYDGLLACCKHTRDELHAKAATHHARIVASLGKYRRHRGQCSPKAIQARYLAILGRSSHRHRRTDSKY